MATKRARSLDDAIASSIEFVEAIKAPAAEVAQPTQMHTYPDGSAVVGCPPWPEKSPMQRAREAAEGKA